MHKPFVSVVVSVHNGAEYLRESLASLLSQVSVEFELIVVDDGSTDGSGDILACLASVDRRLRVLRQENQGLTNALIRGCDEAQGIYIARHDADDLSLPNRLNRQVAFLNAYPECSMVSCEATYIGPAGEVLFAAKRAWDPKTATRLLLEEGVGPPAHGSMMFRADAYRKAGGYRPEFRYAQDWDLWLRLIDLGRIGYVPEVLYTHRIQEGSISAIRRTQQLRLLQVAQACRQARLRGESEEAYLAEAVRVSWQAVPPNGPSGVGNSYFIGKCLLDRRDRRALPYLRRSVHRAPWNWRHWLALAGATLLCRNPIPKGGKS